MKNKIAILTFIIVILAVLYAPVYAAGDSATVANPESSGYNAPAETNAEKKADPEEKGFVANIVEQISSVFRGSNKGERPSNSQAKQKSDKEMRLEPTVLTTVEEEKSAK